MIRALLRGFREGLAAGLRQEQRRARCAAGRHAWQIVSWESGFRVTSRCTDCGAVERL